jgi:hypothetical protein|eukprot:COSAG01_NODE_1030_length_12019_cov_94.008725_2_plen_99_part_00
MGTVVGGIGGIITGTISGVMPAELWIFYYWTVLGGLVMSTALGDLGGSTSAVICVTLYCIFAFIFYDRWISCVLHLIHASTTLRLMSMISAPLSIEHH